MSNRLFQGIIHQMTDTVDRTIGVIDDTGVIIACSELVKIGETRQEARDEMAYTASAVTVGATRIGLLALEPNGNTSYSWRARTKWRISLPPFWPFLCPILKIYMMRSMTVTPL